MQRWRWEELICGNLKVGRERLVRGLVDPGNQVDLSRWILIFALIENSHDGRRVVPGIMAISSHISLSAGSCKADHALFDYLDCPYTESSFDTGMSVNLGVSAYLGIGATTNFGLDIDALWNDLLDIWVR